MGISIGDLSPRETEMGKKCFPQTFVRDPHGKVFSSRGRDGELFPDGKFPVAIPTQDLGDISEPRS
jgi:hypothetical protein